MPLSKPASIDDGCRTCQAYQQDPEGRGEPRPIEDYLIGEAYRASPTARGSKHQLAEFRDEG